ncbi:PIEZ1 protein, partial [Motacilla alba]|nr:PIEZ1 protein [Motacilla alba]
APVPLQLAYQAWVTNARTVLRQQEQQQPPSTDSAAEHSNVLQRALNTLRFLWLLCQALVDGLTQWLDTQTREHTDMSRVLCLERFVMAERLAKGEQINEGFPGELYELPPEEVLQGLSLPSSLAAEPQSGTSRQVHRYPPGALAVPQVGQGAHPCPSIIPSRSLRAAPPSSSQEQVMSVEDMADAQQFLAVPQQRRRTASELLKSR